MITLPNGCKCSSLSVYPKNWQSKSAKTTTDWYLSYRFYHPDYPQPKQVMVKGMNQFKQLSQRQEATKTALSQELDKLLNQAFNPFIKLNKAIVGSSASSPETNISEALQLVYKKIQVSERTLMDIKYVLRSVDKAIGLLGLSNYPISQVTRKTVKLILENASCSADRFNKYRSYLMILFSELCEMELVETNPVRDIKKKKTIKHLRTVLTDQERLLVNDFLKINHPSFHRFLHIFFHSGARISELIQLKASDIDLSRQRYKIIIQKGREYREVWKVIKNIALPFWINLLEKAKVNDYVFSVGLEPGVAQIQSYQITKRWYRLVKKKLNIEADFYSLKHLNLDETASILDINDASVMASHNSTSITSKYYALGEKQRQTERLKNITNKFA